MLSRTAPRPEARPVLSRSERSALPAGWTLSSYQRVTSVLSRIATVTQLPPSHQPPMPIHGGAPSQPACILQSLSAHLEQIATRQSTYGNLASSPKDLKFIRVLLHEDILDSLARTMAEFSPFDSLRSSAAFFQVTSSHPS